MARRRAGAARRGLAVGSLSRSLLLRRIASLDGDLPNPFIIESSGAYPTRNPSLDFAYYVGSSAPTGAAESDLWTPIPVARPVIIDTDWWTDADDVAAIRMAVNLEKIGLIDIRCVCLDTDLDSGPPSLDAVLKYDGRHGTPIGRSHTAHVPSGTPGYQTRIVYSNDHDVGPPSTLEDSVTLMRRTLAAADNNSVDIMAIGYMNNLPDLLNSTADSHSALSGTALVTAKVRHLWVLGGLWPSGSENNFNRTPIAIQAAHDLCEDWPTDVTFMGFEVGNLVYFGGGLKGQSDILAQAISDLNTTYGRRAFDPLLVRLAALDDLEAAGYTAVVGTASVNASTGANSFTENPAGPHRYVVPAQSYSWLEREIEPFLVNSFDPDQYTTGTQILTDGEWIAADAVDRSYGDRSPAIESNATSDYTDGLLMHLKADDLSDLSDEDLVYSWPCRMGNLSARPNLGNTVPQYFEDIGGKPAVQAPAGGKYLVTKSTLLPREMTVYGYVYFGTLPSSNQTLIAADDANSGTNQRSWHVKFINTGLPQIASFNQTTGTTDSGGLTIAEDTWGIIVARVSTADQTIEALMDGTPGTSTSIADLAPNQMKGRLSILSRFNNAASEAFLGAVHEIRVYDVFHDNATMAAVVAEMTP